MPPRSTLLNSPMHLMSRLGILRITGCLRPDPLIVRCAFQVTVRMPQTGHSAMTLLLHSTTPASPSRPAPHVLADRASPLRRSQRAGSPLPYRVVAFASHLDEPTNSKKRRVRQRSWLKRARAFEVVSLQEPLHEHVKPSTWLAS